MSVHTKALLFTIVPCFLQAAIIATGALVAAQRPRPRLVPTNSTRGALAKKARNIPCGTARTTRAKGLLVPDH